MDSDAAATPIDPVLNGDDSALVTALRAGDDAAYERLVREYAPRLLPVARRILDSEHDAQDALQDAFISAFKAIDRFEGTARLSTWLHRITVNASLMKLRSRRRRNERSIDDLVPHYNEQGHRVDTISPWKPLSEDALHLRETREQIRLRIEELPEDYRNVVILRDIEELSTEHAAEVLEITPGAVKTRLHRARQALRTMLEKEFES